MISGRLQGRLLSMLSKMLAPTRILELGTFTGYSALCLAEGLAPTGKLISLENNAEMQTRILQNWAKSPYFKQMELIIGDALQTLPHLNDTFDLIFLDADKQNYLNYYEILLGKLRPGGVLLADNVLWSGKIIDQEAQDKKTKALRLFNNFVRQDNRVELVMLPFRDGLSCIRKK
jgi:predicted O-methyltransferase YrrM